MSNVLPDMTPQNLRMYALEKAYNVAPSHWTAEQVAAYAQTIYDFLAGGTVEGQLPAVPARQAADIPAPRVVPLRAEPVQEPEQVPMPASRKPRAQKALGHRQQQILNVLKDMAEAGELPATMGEIARRSEDPNGVAGIYPTVIGLLNRGYIVRQRSGRDGAYDLAPDPGEDEEEEPSDDALDQGGGDD